MLRRPLALALTALGATAALVAPASPAQADLAAPAAPTGTAGAGPTTSGPTTSGPTTSGPTRVVLTLRTADPVALQQHANRPPDDAQERQERTAQVAPRNRRTVERWLTARGFRIESATDWTITAQGPTHLLTRRLPRELRGAVASAVRDRRGTMRPRAVPVGWAPEELREAYDVVDADGGAGTTIATIQFSGWQSSDAQVFARAAGIPLAPGQITSIPVAGARVDVADGVGGDFEVALDVQAALGAAPAARQRVYVAPNTSAGAVAVYDAVAAAAEQGALTVVSISWGACELETSRELVTALEQSLARMVAAGTTVVAASGDVGAYGCGSPGQPDPRLSVDYPASSPSVLAVGGTSLRRTDSGWSESAWSDRASDTGSGGGVSALFPRPVWQAGQGTRAVPDVAAVADPATGIGIYGPDVDGRRRWMVVGGTSGAAPLVAGQLASTASALGRPLGFGRLHVPLYAAARDGTGLRDVTRGDNLRHLAGPGYDLATGLGSPQWAALGPRLLEPHVIAAPATDSLRVPVTTYAPASRTARYGLAETVESACAQAHLAPPRTLDLDGGPDRATAVVLAVVEDGECRTTSSLLVLDRTAPQASARLGSTSREGVLALSWSGTDPAPSSGLAQVVWRLRDVDTGQVVAGAVASRSGSALRAVPRGTYQLEVRAVDALGRGSRTATSSLLSVG